jgi:predicted O-methyltransferase YrrM
MAFADATILARLDGRTPIHGAFTRTWYARRVQRSAATPLCAVVLLAACANGQPLARHERANAPAAQAGSVSSDATAPQAASPGKASEEQRIMDVLDDLEGKRRGNMNVPREDGLLLRILTEAINAQHVVEIGTSNGYSGIWICLGLRATGGKLTTHEIDPRRADLARANFERAGVSSMVTIVEGDAHEEITKSKESIDLLFIDADKAGYLDYLQKARSRVRPGGLIVSHNMTRPPPDPAFVEAIETDPALETIFLNMDAAGVAVSLKKR